MQRRDFLKSMAGAAGAGLMLTESQADSSPRATPVSIAEIPIIHYTDLFHPPDDPDDHVDLATLFALPEFDIRAIILDLGHVQDAKPGDVPIKQMLALTGRKVPYAVALEGPLRYPEDKGLNQPHQYQGETGADLILRVLKESDRKVVINTTGSLREVAAAFNRDEALFHSKVDRIYVNAGNSAPVETEWNTILDPQAYIRIMRSDLPIYWCPCFGGRITGGLSDSSPSQFRDYQTYWKFRQADIYDTLPSPLKNYFLYALGRKVVSLEDPIAYLSRVPETQLRQEQWAETRNMWCTGPMIHAAARQTYRKGDSWAALASAAPGFELSPVFDFVPASVTVDRDLNTYMKLSGVMSNLKVFRILDRDHYEKAMTSSLRRLLAGMRLATTIS